MNNLLWLVVLLPFAGALILAIFGASLPKKAAGAIGCASIGAAWVLAMIMAIRFIGSIPAGGINASLYQWMNVAGLRIDMGLHLDALSLVMMCVVTFVGFLIHLYASQSMYDEDGYSRFFCYMNLFVGSMLISIFCSP